MSPSSIHRVSCESIEMHSRHYCRFGCFSTARVPGLFDLVFKTKEQKFNGVRWALFDWLFEFGRDFEESLKRLDKKYTVAVVTIKYLLTVSFVLYIHYYSFLNNMWLFLTTHQQGEITAVEADAFLITENFVRERNYASRDLEDSTVLNTHFIRLANLYTKMFCLINHCLEVCGLHPYTVNIEPNRHLIEKMNIFF